MEKRRKYIFASLFAVILITIMTWIVTIVRGEMPFLDQWTRSFVKTVADTSIYTFFRLITELGSKSFLIPFTIVMAIIIWWLFKDGLPAIIFSGGTLTAHIINMLIKKIVARERPMIYIEANAEGFSFPSGHSMITMVCYGFLMYLITKKVIFSLKIMVVQISIALLIFLIGFSRYIINVHFLTDIITGFTFGFLILMGLISLYEYIQRIRPDKNQS